MDHRDCFENQQEAPRKDIGKKPFSTMKNFIGKYFQKSKRKKTSKFSGEFLSPMSLVTLAMTGRWIRGPIEVN